MEKPMKELRQRSPLFAEATGRTAAALLLVGATILALVAVQLVTSGKSKWWAPVSGLAVNVIVFEWAILLRLAMPINLPARYFRVSKFERTGTIYETLMVRQFGRLVVQRIPFMGNRRGLAQFAERSRHAETVHLFSLVGLTPLILSLSLQHQWRVAVWTLLFSVPIHIYPIMLQRHNRMRIERLLARGLARASQSSPPDERAQEGQTSSVPDQL